MDIQVTQSDITRAKARRTKANKARTQIGFLGYQPSMHCPIANALHRELNDNDLSVGFSEVYFGEDLVGTLDETAYQFQDNFDRSRPVKPTVIKFEWVKKDD